MNRAQAPAAAAASTAGTMPMKVLHTPEANDELRVPQSDWRDFVLQHGHGARADDLAAVLGLPTAEIKRLRGRGAAKRQTMPKSFAELFALWHGRGPDAGDWPAPAKAGHGAYEWQPPELELLASLVGQLGNVQIAQVLTQRLREVTGDARALRDVPAVVLQTNRMGLRSTDVVGGITVKEASAQAGSPAAVYDAIEAKALTAWKVGRVWVIPRAAWQRWLARRTIPPAGFIRLSTLKEPLGVRSDKLSEFARLGLVPSAVRCNPSGTGLSTQNGTWWIDPKQAKVLIEDRRAGRPMPWHGQALPDNLRRSFARWCDRRHPDTCAICAGIWGENGAPRSYEDYAHRYPPLAQGPKRHLTQPWSAGLKVAEVAKASGCTAAHVRLAITNGALIAAEVGGTMRVSREAMTRWRARRCPTGEAHQSWQTVATACRLYGFTEAELRAFIAEGRLQLRIGGDGPHRGVELVSRNGCAQLRHERGFTLADAATRAGVPEAQLRRRLQAAGWRAGDPVPVATLRAITRRLKSQEGYTVAEAVKRLEFLGVTTAWITDCIERGIVVLASAPWAPERRYLSNAMIERLKAERAHPSPRRKLTDGWLRLSQAATEAGVTTSTIVRWASEGQLAREAFSDGWRYQVTEVRRQARRYWSKRRGGRTCPPSWLDVGRVAALP